MKWLWIRPLEKWLLLVVTVAVVVLYISVTTAHCVWGYFGSRELQKLLDSKREREREIDLQSPDISPFAGARKSVSRRQHAHNRFLK